MLVRELAEAETGLAYRVMHELRVGRPKLASLDAFVAWVNEMQRPEGYRLAASFADGTDDAVAVAGFRHAHNLAWGDHIYVDDLVTLPEFRAHGHAHAIFEWLVAEAERLGCEQLHLDSGVQRFVAHRFYLNHRMDITSHHFQRVLRQP